MSDPTSPSPTVWPKPYLLKVYDQCLAEGCCRLDFAGNRQLAKSFIAAFYRIRRRSDTQHQAFIRPEFHLCTCTWEQARGTVLVTYSSLPDGHDLPPILSLSASEKAELHKPKVLGTEELADATAGMAEPELDSDAFIDELIADAASRIGEDDADG